MLAYKFVHVLNRGAGRRDRLPRFAMGTRRILEYESVGNSLPILMYSMMGVCMVGLRLDVYFRT